MTYKSQLFLFSSCDRPMSFGHSWASSTANLQNATLLAAGADSASKVRPGIAPRVEWNTVLGLVLATAVSASIWTGLALVVERLWK